MLQALVQFVTILKEIKKAHKNGQPVLVGTSSVENSELVGSSDLIFSVENIDNFYRFFPIPKKLRKKINNIKITYKYNFTTKELEIKNLLMDNKEVNQETKDLIDKFNANKKIKNKINFRNIVNELLSTL